MSREQVKVGKFRWTKLNDQEYVSGQWRIRLRAQDTAILSPYPNYELQWTVYGPDDDYNGEGHDWGDTPEEAMEYAERRAAMSDAEKERDKLEELHFKLQRAALVYIYAVADNEGSRDVDEIYRLLRARTSPSIAIRKSYIRSVVI